MTMMKELKTSKVIDIRFSEVDSMKIVWHGSYPLYFEDAREAFGKKFGLEYMDIYGNGFYAPLVDLSFKYKKPITYGMRPEITITYKETDAAKIVFDYRHRRCTGNRPFRTGFHGSGLPACMVHPEVL